MIDLMIEIGLTLVVIPWCTFVTVSLFNQRQEIALLKLTHDELKNHMGTLVNFLKS